MEKIDLTECNNCRFRAKDEDGDISGRIRVSERGTVYLFVDGQDNKGYLADMMMKMGITDFEIVPRDPETYRDWRVGDLIGCLDEEGDMDIMADHLCRVIFRSGELVAIADNYSAEQADINGCYTCSQLFREGWRLVLTDIEQKIIEERKKYEPQDGDVCFVKTAAGNCFIFIKRDHKPDEKILSDACLDTNLQYLCPAKVSCVCDRKSIRELRPATDEEKQKLFDAMSKLGKRWNAEKKVMEDIPKPHEFKKGEPVLVRGYEFHRWIIAAYVYKDKLGFIANAGVSVIHWKYCIPYNERTMHLLGTTEDYKEDL